MKADHSYGLHFDSVVLTEEHIKGKIVHALYPYQSIKLRVIYVHRSDFKYEMDIVPFSRAIQIIIALILLFICFSATILWLIRRKLQRRWNNFSASFIECLVPFIGGGSMTIQHKLERWFFIILLFGAFIIVAMFGGDIVDNIVTVQSSKMDTFEKLAKTKSVIYLPQSLGMHNDQIRLMIERKMNSNCIYRGISPYGMLVRISVMIKLNVQEFTRGTVCETPVKA